MFEIIEIKNYDTNSRYGTDWHTDYFIKTDQEMTIQEIIEKCKACGECTLEKSENGYILKTVMY